MAHSALVRSRAKVLTGRFKKNNNVLHGSEVLECHLSAPWKAPPLFHNLERCPQIRRNQRRLCALDLLPKVWWCQCGQVLLLLLPSLPILFPFLPSLQAVH